MLRGTTNRSADDVVLESNNRGWVLLPRRESSGCNRCIVVQRFGPGGIFQRHMHDMEQFFFVSRGRIEMTIAGDTRLYDEGDLVFVDRNQPHCGRNVSEGIAELVLFDYWPPDSLDRIGLD